MSSYHKVMQGECLDTIALKYGFADYSAIWNAPQNSALKQKRKNPNIIAPDDILFIPNAQPKDESRGTGSQHLFHVRKAKVRLRIVLNDASGKPLVNGKYSLKLSDSVLEGVTDDKGLLEQQIPINAQRGELSFTELDLKWTLNFGHLNPIETISGVQARLLSLGYSPGPITDKDNAPTQNAVRAFQRNNGIPVSGRADMETKAALVEKFGC